MQKFLRCAVAKPISSLLSSLYNAEERRKHVQGLTFAYERRYTTYQLIK